MATDIRFKEPEDTLVLPVRTGQTERVLPAVEGLVVPEEREHGERAGAIDAAVIEVDPPDFVRFMQSHWLD